MKATSLMAIVVGIYLMWFQWGSFAKSQKTVRLMTDLVWVYGDAYGNALAWTYVLIAPVAIAIAILTLILEFRFWKKNQTK